MPGMALVWWKHPFVTCDDLAYPSAALGPLSLLSPLASDFARLCSQQAFVGDHYSHFMSLHITSFSHMFYVLGIFRCKVEISVEIFGPTLIEWSVVSWEKVTPSMVKSPCFSHCNLSQLYLWICFELQGCLGLQTRTNHPFLVPKIAASQLKLSTELPWNRGCRRRFCPHRSPRKVERRGVARQTSWSKHNLLYLFLGGKMSKQHSIWSKMSIELKTILCFSFWKFFFGAIHLHTGKDQTWSLEV